MKTFSVGDFIWIMSFLALLLFGIHSVNAGKKDKLAKALHQQRVAMCKSMRSKYPLPSGTQYTGGYAIINANLYCLEPHNQSYQSYRGGNHEHTTG